MSEGDGRKVEQQTKSWKAIQTQVQNLTKKAQQVRTDKGGKRR